MYCRIDNKQLKFDPVNAESWMMYKPEKATCNGCKTEYQRWPSSDFAYMKRSNGYVCTLDGTEILEVDVTHMVHIFKGVGTGEVIHEKIPYCPFHEERPSDTGKPVKAYEGDPWEQEFKEIRRSLKEL